MLARDLVEKLREQALDQFDVPVHLECTAERIEYDGDDIVLHTNEGPLRSRTVIVAGGHGAFEPKRLPRLRRRHDARGRAAARTTSSATSASSPASAS